MSNIYGVGGLFGVGGTSGEQYLWCGGLVVRNIY